MSPIPFAEARSLLRSFRARPSKSQKSSFLGSLWPQRSLGEPPCPVRLCIGNNPGELAYKEVSLKRRSSKRGFPVSWGCEVRVGIGGFTWSFVHITELKLPCGGWSHLGHSGGQAPQGPSGTEPGRHVPGISVCGVETRSRAGRPAGVTDGLCHLQTQLEPRLPHDRAEGCLQGLESSFRIFF